MEYQEIGQFARHDDTVNLTVSSVLLPVLVAALGWAWQHHDLEAPLALGSLVVWVYWIVVKKRRNDFLLTRLARARKLEEEAGLGHHLGIRKADDAQKGLRTLVRIKQAERLASTALIGAWIWLFFVSLSPVLLTLGLMAVAIVGFVAVDRELNHEPAA